MKADLQKGLERQLMRRPRRPASRPSRLVLCSVNNFWTRWRTRNVVGSVGRTGQPNTPLVISASERNAPEGDRLFAQYAAFVGAAPADCDAVGGW
jgi:hypothetical protein